MTALRAACSLIGVLLLTHGCARALPPPDPESALATADPAASDPAAAERLMVEAAAAYRQRPDEQAVEESITLWLRAAVADATDAAPIIGAVRAQTWLAEYAAEPSRRNTVAQEAVQTAQWCRRREVSNPDCSYYLALAVGVQANQVRSTATEGLDIIVRALNNAIESGEREDQAGPHRVLALVYLRAPGWPLGPGNPDTGLIHAEAAVDLFPGFAPNWLALAEAYDKTEQVEASGSAYHCALELAVASVNPDAATWRQEAETALSENPGTCSDPRYDSGSKPSGQ